MLLISALIKLISMGKHTDVISLVGMWSLCTHVLVIRLINQRALKSSHDVPKGLTYADAGVSVDAGNSLVETIKPFVRSTHRAGANTEIGGFGGVFDLKATGYKDPILVSGTDGVGTKLRVASDVGIHDFVGESTSISAPCPNS
jgi:hypothetical protein